jgi:hypothetical protein
MGSCRGVRGRNDLRNLLLKLFPSDLAFIVISFLSNVKPRGIRYHAAVAGFSAASFEGGRKSGGERGRLLNCGPAMTKSDAIPTKKGNPYGSD